MRFIRLAPAVLLVITDNIISEDLNDDNLYLYQYGTGFSNRKQLVWDDSELEARNRSFGFFGSNRILLSPTPNFYPDDAVSGGFHAASTLDNILTNPPSSQIGFLDCRLMFASGFSYKPSDNGISLQSLSIQFRRSDATTVDLLNFTDDFSSSEIVASEKQYVIDGTVFNSEIALRLLDIESFFNATSADVVELRDLLFGTDYPEVFYVEYAGVNADGIDNAYNEFAKTYTRLIPFDTNSVNVPVALQDNDIITDIDISDNGSVKVQMQHTRFNLEGYLNTRGLSADNIEYELTYSQYDALSSLIGTTSYKLSNSLNVYDPVEFIPFPINDDTDYIEISVNGRIITTSGAVISKIGTAIIPDASVLRGLELDFEFEDYNLVENVTQEIKEVNTLFDAPSVVRITEPVYVQGFSVGTIELVPATQVIEIQGVFDSLSSESQEFQRNFQPVDQDAFNTTPVVTNPITESPNPQYTVLQIGERQYRNIEGSLFRYEVDKNAYDEGAKRYMILNPDGKLIAKGEVTNLDF